MTTKSFARMQDDSEGNILTIEENDHSKSRDLQDNVIQKNNFSSPRCSACKDEMQFSEGDVIYGDKWYHNLCWKEIQKMAEMAS